MPGLDQPATNGESYGSQDISDSDPTRVIPADVESGSYIVRAGENNTGTIYLGWDDDVTSSNGFPLKSEESFSADINNASQQLWAIADNNGDELRHIATN